MGKDEKEAEKEEGEREMAPAPTNPHSRVWNVLEWGKLKAREQIRDYKFNQDIY